jgi:pyridoxine kinase
MQLLSIQSHVAYGHVGNSAAVFALQRLGCEVWPIHTVQFSNHTGYGAWTGRVFDAAIISELMGGLAARGVLAACDGLISGYMGSADTGAAILDAVATVKAANPAARYCCDPVIGDVHRGVFVRAGIVEFMRDRAVRCADIVTPNHFELDCLVGGSSKTMKETCDAIDALHAIGPGTVLVTSVRTQETPDDALDLIASDGAGRFRLRTPKLPIAADGAGDLMAALFMSHLLERGSTAEALSRATSAVFGLLKRTAAVGAREMRLIEAQEELVNPSTVFPAERI